MSSRVEDCPTKYEAHFAKKTPSQCKVTIAAADDDLGIGSTDRPPGLEQRQGDEPTDGGNSAETNRTTATDHIEEQKPATLDPDLEWSPAEIASQVRYAGRLLAKMQSRQRQQFGGSC